MAAKTLKCRQCPALIYPDSITGLCIDCYNKQRAAQVPSAMVNADRERGRLAEELSMLRKKYDDSLKTNKRLERTLRSRDELFTSPIETFAIEPQDGEGTSEGTCFWTASDWHSEERVDPRRISGLNEFNLEIAKERAAQFFQGGLRLTRMMAQDIKIQNVVIPLLGDFISNDIHDEAVETAQLEPMHAITFARNLLISGIDFTLNNSQFDLMLYCHTGNHGRTTHKTRFATENGHSLEYLMYLHLADYYRGEKRVQFNIADGPHSYLEVYGKTLRFHHGHMVNYQGGVGGIYIPLNKAISQWNKARHADLDVLGHFHQYRDGGNFIVNGSLIGYNSFALSIKADFEPPKQALFLIDKKRGRTGNWPILFKR